jgi:hypothetical protein
MAEIQEFKAAFPYQQDVLALPVTDLDIAAATPRRTVRRFWSATFRA